MIMAFCFLLARREDQESHRQLNVALLAQSEDGKAIKAQMEMWEDEAS